jgi:hypothetical protein
MPRRQLLPFKRSVECSSPLAAEISTFACMRHSGNYADDLGTPTDCSVPISRNRLTAVLSASTRVSLISAPQVS